VLSIGTDIGDLELRWTA